MAIERIGPEQQLSAARQSADLREQLKKEKPTESSSNPKDTVSFSKKSKKLLREDYSKEFQLKSKAIDRLMKQNRANPNNPMAHWDY